MHVDPTRDQNLTDFGKETLKDRYLLPGETYQELFLRVATHYGNDEAHSQRLYDYMSKLWFMPATPILSNGGNNRGMPISCFLSEASDDMSGIVNNWVENAWLACRGGGIGTYWGNIRSIGERIGRVGKSSGVVPFIKVQDSLTLAISQGSLRRGSAAVYMPVDHPEIEEFIDIRRPTGGDPNRKALNLHHGLVVSDKFMTAVQNDTEWELLSPKDRAVVRKVPARDLWIRILTARVETGEPYIMYIDHVNKARPWHQEKLGLMIKTSNLCTEITLPTGIDHLGNDRTAVCCLSSLNLETYNEWKDHPNFVEDVLYFLDNVLQDFIDNAPDTHSKAKYSAMRERSVGLGVMGLHSLYQQEGMAWSSVEAKELNKEIFRTIRNHATLANQKIAKERGACPDAIDAGLSDIRFSTMLAVAPTASISIICGGASPGVEPNLANYYTHKTLSGSFGVKNKYVVKLLRDYGMDTAEVWSSIAMNEGSVQHLDFLSDQEREVFKTAFEIDQMDIVAQAADRASMIDQAQSVNLFLPPDVSKSLLHQLHFSAWEQGVKTLYYCRSRSMKRAEKASEKVERQVIVELKDRNKTIPQIQQYEVCQSCQ